MFTTIFFQPFFSLLHDKGYILNYKFEDDVNFQGNIKVALKYNSLINHGITSKNIIYYISSCHCPRLEELENEGLAREFVM